MPSRSEDVLGLPGGQFEWRVAGAGHRVPSLYLAVAEHGGEPGDLDGQVLSLQAGA